MADVQLNKPLYKEEGIDTFVQPIPRPPRASLLGRGAAVFLDIMFLHLVFAGVVRFIPDVPLALGPLAPWVGLLLGFLYFGIGFSHLTLGRTLGKLITRVQVAEIAGPDLPLGRAFLRAGLFLWPLPVQLLLRNIAEHYAGTNPTSIYTSIEVFGTMLIFGWVLGNLGFAAFDPYGRTVYDRAADSVVINAELEAEPVAAYLADVRTASLEPPLRRSITTLGLALTVCMAFAAASSISIMRQLRDLTPVARERVQALVVPQFGRAWPAPPLSEAVTTETIPVSFHFRKRGHVDAEALKADVATTGTFERLIANTTGPDFMEEIQDYINSSNMDRMKRGEAPTSAPERIQFELSFVEYADLFFAKEAHPVYTLSREIDLPTSITELQ